MSNSHKSILENGDMSEPHIADTIDVASTNRRLDKVEHDVQVLNTAVATMTTEVRNLYKIQHESSQKLDKLLDQGGVNSATRGMIPASYITWGVSAFIAVVAVGLTALTLALNYIKEDIVAGNALTSKEFERLDTRIDTNKENLNSVHLTIDREAQYGETLTDLKIAKLQLQLEKEKELLSRENSITQEALLKQESRLDAILKSLSGLNHASNTPLILP